MGSCHHWGRIFGSMLVLHRYISCIGVYVFVDLACVFRYMYYLHQSASPDMHASTCFGRLSMLGPCIGILVFGVQARRLCVLEIHRCTDLKRHHSSK